MLCPANKPGTWLYKATNCHSYSFIYVNKAYLSSLIACLLCKGVVTENCVLLVTQHYDFDLRIGVARKI